MSTADTLLGDDHVDETDLATIAAESDSDAADALTQEPEVAALLEYLDPHLTRFKTMDKVFACLGKIGIVRETYTHAHELNKHATEYTKLRYALLAVEDISGKSIGNKGGDFMARLRFHCCSALNGNVEIRKIMDEAIDTLRSPTGDDGIITLLKERVQKPMEELDNHYFLQKFEFMPPDITEQFCEHIKQALPELAMQLSARKEELYTKIWPTYKKFMAAKNK